MNRLDFVKHIDAQHTLNNHFAEIMSVYDLYTNCDIESINCSSQSDSLVFGLVLSSTSKATELKDYIINSELSNYNIKYIVDTLQQIENILNVSFKIKASG